MRRVLSKMGRFQAAFILFQFIKKEQIKSPKGSFIIPQGIQDRQCPPPASFQTLAINYRKLCSRPPPQKESPGLRKQESDGAAALVQGNPLTPRLPDLLS